MSIYYQLFSKEELTALVEYNEKKIFEVKLKEMKSALTTQITEETDISEVIETVKVRVRDAKLPDIEVVRVLWDVLMDAVQWSGKNQQQNANSALRQVFCKYCLRITLAKKKLKQYPVLSTICIMFGSVITQMH